ncbi:hypothetical protein PT281_03850 [Lactobacillus sp. ESL0701]|uniref:hypothetical protein n=1 Tax=Lactobacillus sp. ESL0701 TaxID=2983217 RepID=UPI0023F7545A|nr:hypothetical protein [Lactobacillus sp. ESL0701]MDF7672397.1 hypothetical protein [Lactobacillus sp. ESL0701]
MGKNVVIAQFFTKMYNAQNNEIMTDVDIIKKTQQLYASVSRFGLELHTLVNFKNENTVPPLQKIINVEPFSHYPSDKFYFLRWEVTFEYLLKHPEIEKAALVDAGDVQMMNYPFADLQEDTLYIGDEGVDLQTEIIKNDSKPRYLAQFIRQNCHLQLLNAGVLVGTRQVLLEFLGILTELYVQDAYEQTIHPDEEHLGNYEMSLVNYIAYQCFTDRLCHGRQVVTRFQYFERTSAAWFKHK